MTKDFYSTIEAGRILNISRVSVFNRIKTGKLKATKVGRNFVIPHAAILEALGQKVGHVKKAEIERAIDLAMRDYEETFRLLAKE